MRLGTVRYQSKYLAIQHFHNEKKWDISWMCRVLGISRASFYKWLHREIPEAELENQKIAVLVQEYDERFGHILGYRRMTLWINRFNGTNYSRKRIHRLMKELNIHSAIRKRKRATTPLNRIRLRRMFSKGNSMQPNQMRNGQPMLPSLKSQEIRIRSFS